MSSITRWNPVRDLINLREAMDQFVSEGLSRARDYRAAWQLPIDAYVTEDAIMLMADVPGLKPEELEVTLEGDTLTIRGEFRNRVEGKNYLLQERVSGHFERTLTINTPIDSAKIEATFTNGVLTLKLPKAEAVKPKQITIKQA
jgi:HSP20 family protein